MTAQLHILVAVHVCIIVVGVANTTIPFGDSLMDTGNNMYINCSVSIGNHLSYERDFPTHVPTGRVSNEKLVLDFIASMLNLKDTVPPYLAPNLSNKKLLTSVCFASAASGLDNVTGIVFNVITMFKQIEYFKTYRAKLKYIVREDETRRILANALVVTVSSNNFIFNFYDFRARRVMFTMDEYQDYLLVKFHNYVKDLYDLGCRKFGIARLGPTGCTPFQFTVKFQIDRQCVEEENTYSE